MKDLNLKVWLFNKTQEDMLKARMGVELNITGTTDDIEIEKIKEERLKNDSVHRFIEKQRKCTVAEYINKESEKKIIYDDGTVYEGEIKNNMRHGKGKLTDPNGDVFIGKFWNDIINGKGKFTGVDGSVYDGEWKNGMREGYGKESLPDGSTYEGNYEDGFKNGQGIYHWIDGSIYNGEWKAGMIDGKVRL